MHRHIFSVIFAITLTGAGAHVLQAGQTGAAGQESGRRATASDYSIGADMLRGQVLAKSGQQLSVRDAATGEPVTVLVSDPLLITNIEPGDLVRVSFAEDGKTAAQVAKENK